MLFAVTILCLSVFLKLPASVGVFVNMCVWLAMCSSRIMYEAFIVVLIEIVFDACSTQRQRRRRSSFQMQITP